MLETLASVTKRLRLEREAEVRARNAPTRWLYKIGFLQEFPSWHDQNRDKEAIWENLGDRHVSSRFRDPWVGPLLVSFSPLRDRFLTCLSPLSQD